MGGKTANSNTVLVCGDDSGRDGCGRLWISLKVGSVFGDGLLHVHVRRELKMTSLILSCNWKDKIAASCDGGIGRHCNCNFKGQLKDSFQLNY